MRRAAWLPWTIASLVGTLVGGSAMRAIAQKPGEVGFAYGDRKDVTLQGRIVDLGDLLGRKYGARLAGGEGKQWALALPEGQIYTFVDNDRYRKLLAASPAGQPVEVQALQFPRSQVLEVQSFKAIPAAAISRRFHCDVCNVDTEEFGPCVCCGKEMQVVRTPK